MAPFFPSNEKAVLTKAKQNSQISRLVESNQSDCNTQELTKKHMKTLCDKEKYLHGFQMLLTCLSYAFEIFNGNKLEYRVQYID